MASRRRLDISSLLCDSNEQSSASRTEPKLSRFSGQYEPQVSTTQAQSLDEQGAFVYSKPPSTHNNHQHERISQGQRAPQQRWQEDGPAYWENRSPGPLPSPADLVPLPTQRSSSHQHSPSQSFSPPGPSPIESGGSLRLSRHSDGPQEITFPRPSSSSATQPETHPHRYTQFPQPPSSTSPVNIHHPSESVRGRGASAQISHHQYSPISLPHPSPSPSSASSLPNNFSASARHLSLSPTDLTHPHRPSTSSSGDKPFQRLSVLPRQIDTRMNTSRRTSASLSPSVTFSGLSGLDVLVQAATEERERIDVHRRLSGSDEHTVSPDYATYARHVSLSPVVPKGEIFQVPPPTPPYSANSQPAVYLPAEQADVYYRRQEVEDNVNRRRSSPELQVDDVRLYENIPGPSSIVVDNLRHRSQVSDTTGNGYDRHSRLQDTSTVQSVASRHFPGSRPGSLYATSSPTRNETQRTSLEDLETSSSSHFPHTFSPVDSGTTPYVRRSPPRSRPKPKKPGSAALASLGKELAESHVKDTAGSRQVRRPSPPRSQFHSRVSDVKPTAQQSNERGASEDEEVDDFFLSAFDSPRQVERQVSAQKPGHFGLSPTRTGGISSERWHQTQSSLATVQHHAYSPMIQRSSFERANEYSDYSSPARGDYDHDDEETMPDVEAEIFDELADAAGGMTSEAERTDFDDQATENMEVDVENELLSLIDGTPEPSLKLHHHAKPPSMHSSNHSDLQDFVLGQVSMPPPDASKGTGAKPKDTKKKPAKPKLKPAKAPAFEAAKPAKVSSTQPEDSSAKPSKSKASAKPRPPKGQPAEKGKGAKTSKEPATPISTPLPVLSESAAVSSSIPTHEAFPIVTSSGRMVTKSKKSAAASTSVVHNQTSSSHRKKAAPPAAGDGGSSRSRSHSVMPQVSVDHEVRREKAEKTTKEDEDKPKEKDAPAPEADDPDKNKLYCLCRTQYDEDRVMIACDRCDEWYHTQCVNMPDLLVDLVDQFICLNCVAQNPSLYLRTTYKQRCYSGHKHPNPDSPEACHKPSRGAYSKYCSDECGVRHLHRKIQSWAGNGGDVRSLWESVKDAKRREGFVTREPGRSLPKAILAEIQNSALPITQSPASDIKPHAEDEKGRNTIVLRLEEQLQTVVQEREELKKQLEVLAWRERLLQLASDRAENVGDCGWDQRLVYGDEEWHEFGAGVLESYDDVAPNGHGHSEEDQEMDVDGETIVGEWWCRGKKKCERHAGWQRVRAADLETERTTKDESLTELTTREREIRNRIEDILHPQSRSTVVCTESTLKFKLSSSEGGGKKTKKKPASASTTA